MNPRPDDGQVTTLSHVELGVLGPLQVRQYGLPVAVPGAKPRAVLTMLGLHGGSVVTADALAELLWGARPPRTAVKALQTHISSLRRALGDGYVLTEGTGWTLSTTEIDATRYKLAARQGRDAFAGGDAGQAVARFDEALALWRGAPELPDGPRGGSEKTRWIEGHAALVEDRADALLATGRAAEIVGELEAAIADAPLRERRWSQLMLALYRAGRQGEALAAYQRARSMLADELGVDPGPDLRRLEAAIVAQDVALEIAVPEQLSIVTRAVTFLLTDIEGSTAAWEADAEAMATALARHDEIVEQVVTSRGGRLVKTRGEGDATFSVFDRPSGAAAAAIELQEAIRHEPWVLAEPMRIRVALHTGEVELRDGDYFGRAVNRAARLRSLAAGGQILCSGATAELVIDTLADDVLLVDLGSRQLKNLARPEHVFELRLETAVDSVEPAVETPIERPALPAVLAGPGPFVGRVPELEGLLAEWESTLAAGARAVLISGEPGVGKTRLAGEWSRLAYEQGAVVLYGRCDEDLGAAYQPFAEALRSLVPCLGANRLRGMRGIEALLLLVPGLTDTVPDLPTPTRSDPDTERYALFDAVVALLAMASTSAPVVLILDDLHWAAKPTLLLLRHLLRFGEHARVQIVGTYRSTDLDRSHPLAAMLADLHRDGSASRLALGGLDEDDVTAYVAEAGYDDVELARALASVTGGNPFFLIEALRHVAESGGRWDPSTLPQGVREAVSRRLSRLPAETNKALAAAAVVGSRFPLALVEQVVGEDLIDAFDEACKAGIVIEEPGGRYRFNHALVRQSLLAELASVRRMRLHQRIANTLEAESGADDELLAELAYHYFECAWAGNAAKAVEYCRRAADQAIERLAYEGAAELYDRALHALEELDDELPDRDALEAELLVARCEALLAAGDVGSAAGAVAQLRRAAGDSVRLSAWGTCFDGQLSMLTNPERLDEIESEVGAAAQRLAELDDAAGEANAHTVRAACLARLGRIADSETALDQALTAARRARDHRRVNAVLAGAPLAALWGPNPVPRAGGRCLDVVRLLRITTGSPVVEATSTRCQGVLDAMRGRAAAGRQLIDSARRTLTELGMRHALLEVDQFAGIVELVADDPVAAEPHLRRAYDGFRRMGLDADTAETAAFLARTCLVLDRDAEADELCRESERLAGHALRPSITWRTVRAQLHARAGAHDEARRVAGEAVSIAERTDALVDHGDACLTLAMVLAMAGDTCGSRAAAEEAVALFERKGAAALVERARRVLGSEPSAVPLAPEEPIVEPENECVRTLRRVEAAVNREAWSEVEQAHAEIGYIESRRKIVGFERIQLPASEMASGAKRFIRDMQIGRSRRPIVAIRGERLAIARTEVGTADDSPGAPLDEMLQLVGLDGEGRIALQIWFDVDDLEVAITEMESVYSEGASSGALENECVRVIRRLDDAYDRVAWDEVEQYMAAVVSSESHRKIVGQERIDRPFDEWVIEAKRFRQTLGGVRYRHEIVAIRGERLALTSLKVGPTDQSPGAPRDELLQLYGLDRDGRIGLHVWFDVEDMDAAITELDAQHKRVEQQPQNARLANAASRVDARFNTLFAGRRWDEVVSIWADDVTVEDRRRGLRREVNCDHASGLAEVQAIADLGVQTMTSTVIAVRGERLALSRTRYSGRDRRPEAFHTEVLRIIEINPEGRCVASIAFDVDDLDSAFAELDARYLASEATPHAHVWSVIVDTYAEFNRADYANVVNIDHRKSVRYAPGELTTARMKELMPNLRSYVEVVHQLTDAGVVVTGISSGTSAEGFEAEWRMVLLLMVDGDHLAWNELFDEADLKTALRRFDELTRPKPQLENSASRVNKHFDECFAARDWPAMAALLAEDMCNDDRRQVIGAGIRYGRDAEVANMQAIVDLGVMDATSEVVAVRGTRLALLRTRFSGRDRRPEAFRTDILDIVEINGDGWIARRVAFDADDLDAAFAELDARYISGEAAVNAHVWSVVAGAYAAVNRHELPPWTADTVDIDRRSTTALAPGELRAYLRAAWGQTPDVRVDIIAVHRLTSFGALVTHVATGTTEQGFEGEWREITLSIVEGDRISRSEMFDEADLDAALARFDELANPATRLENTASRVEARAQVLIAAGHWDAMAEVLADDVSIDDRRRVVNAGLRRGRDAVVEDLRVGAEIGLTHITPRAIAIRGERLTLGHIRYSGDEERPEVGVIDPVQIVEIDADERITALVLFDADNLGAAVEELESRYVSGEGAALARTWSVIAENCAALNRQELPERAPGSVYVDRRRVANMWAADVSEYFRAAWELTPDMTTFVETVHRLSDVGAVVSQVAQGASHDGFYAEWRVVNVYTVEDGLMSRCEVFDEADLDAALARFDELSQTTARFANTASRVVERFRASFSARDWNTMAGMLADDLYNEDRRPVVDAGIRHGRDSLLQDMRSAADAGIPTLCSTDLATRGERLLLVRAESSYEARPGAFYVENFAIAEIDADHRVTAQVVFGVDDVDAAFQELDKRYVAGEAAAYASTWSVIANGYAALNRHEIPPTTPDWVNMDHRRGGSTFATGDMTTYIRASWEDSPQNKIHIETVHRLNHLGAVVTSATRGVSVAGFYAEWRQVDLVIVDGNMLCRTELFDEKDLEVALAAFDELSSPARRLENAASRAEERARKCFAERDWASMAECLVEGISFEDRRRVVNAGTRTGRIAAIADARTVAELGGTQISSQVIATRGDHLVLARSHLSSRDRASDAFQAESLCVTASDADGRIATRVVFDPNAVDAALAELDARYIAGEGAAHSRTWALVTEAYAAFNRHEFPPGTAEFVSLDHRCVIASAPDDLAQYVRAVWELAPDAKAYVETAHRVSNRGAVVVAPAHGTSEEGFDPEWREVHLLIFEGDLLSRFELFDEADLDAAIARFDELTMRAPRIENATTRIWDRLADAFNRRDVDAFVDLTASDGHFADRRMGLRDFHDGATRRRVVETLFEYPELWRLDVEHIAVRGSRLCLSRQTFRDFGDVDRPTCVEILTLTESASNDLVHDFILFDPDDIEPALAELDARYLAGEGAAHAQMWALVVDSYARFNRHEPPLTTTDWENIDHRRVTAFEPGDLTNYVRAAFTVTPDTHAHIAAVHRLSDLGAVITASTYGTSPQGFRAEWRDIHLLTFEGDLGNRFELFDDDDLEAALARFDEINKPPPRPDNAAMRAWRRFSEVYNRRDLEGFLAVHDEDAYYDDRRKGLRDEGPVDPDVGRALLFEAAPSWRLSIDLIATRGEALALMRGRFRDIDEPDGPSVVEVLAVVEVSDRELIAYEAFFDPDEIDSALAELDARFLAGVDAAHSHIWKLVNQTYARFNRHELSQTTTDWVNVDHRRAMVPAPGEMNEYVSAMWAVAPDVRTRIESVHRLTHLGAVFTHTESGTSREGFDAEWREITLLMFDGELISRCELFDDDDLDTALSWFDKLSVPATHLDNAAIRGDGRAADAFNRGDLEGYLGVLATNAQYDDRRRGLRNAGPIDREFVRGLLFTGPSSWRVEIEPVAIRGRHLALVRHICRDSGEAGKPVVAEVLAVVEAQDDERISRSVLFDLDEIAAAFQELDSQYLAGEAAQCRDTWSAVAQMYSGLNRHELPAWITDVVHLDYRTVVTIDPNDLAETLRTAWDLVPDLTMYVESIHRLTDVGAVVTNRSYGRSKEGFDAEWRMIQVLTVGRGRIDHFELFDEGDIDAALARLDELSSSATRLENAASRARAQVCDTYNRRDVDGFLSLASGRYVDRRKGLQYEGAADGDYAAAVLSGTPTSWHLEHEAVAIRGDRLALSHETFRDTADAELPVTVELIALTDLTDKFVPCVVFFDPDDIHSAFAELTARWVASGEVEHPAVIQSAQRIFDMANRHDWAAIANRLGDATYVSHRQLGLDDADISGYLSSIQLWASLVPDLWVEVAEVFAHSAMGVLARLVLKGTSTEGTVVEVPAIYLILLDGDRVTHLETYDPQQRDMALARFEELSVTAPLSDNAVTRLLTGVVDSINRRDVDSYLSIFTDDARYEDRRKGLRDAGPVKPDFARAVVDGAGTGWQVEVECIANRGPHLVLCHLTYRDHDEADHPVVVEALFIAEITVSQLISTLLLFDPDDIDAALAELTARWIASGECGHPGVMEAIQTFAESANRHEWDKLATRHAGATYTNHLQLRAGADTVADDMSSLRMLTSLVPDLRFELTDVLRLSATGIVIHTVAKGTSTNDVPFDLPFVVLLLVDGHRIVHAETYDLDQREQALTRFDELTVDGPQPNNALARVLARVVDAFDRRDPDRYLALFSEDCTYEDRRKGLRDAGSIRPDYAQTVTFGAAAGWQAEFETIAVRGEHLMLGRATFRDQSEAGNPIAVEALNIGSINKDELIFWFAVLDPDDIDAAFAELTARWIASGAVAYPDVIKAALRSNEMYNRHDWDAIAANECGATYVNHRQLLSAEPETIEDHWRSIRALASLIPDLRTEPVEILAHSAKGVLTDLVVKGRTPEGAVIEFPAITLILFGGTRVIHLEAFDVNQRDQALARFDELHGQD